MSKTYKDTWFINVILTLFIVFLFAPTILFCAILLPCMFLLNIKGKYGIFMGIVLAIIVYIFAKNAIQVFGEDLIIVFKNSIFNISNRNIFKSLTSFKYYRPSSYIFLFCISFIISGHLISRIQKQKNKEKAGIKLLESEIKEMTKNDKNHKEKWNKNNTFIGVNRSGKKIYCDDNAKLLFTQHITK